MAQADEMMQQLRDLVERNIEQARTAYAHYLDTAADVMRAWTSSPNMDTRFKYVQELAIRFAKENGESAFALGRDLAAAKDLPQLLTLQNRYAQEQMQAYARQAQELGQAMAQAAQRFVAAQTEAKASSPPKATG
jgi:hypothetical protein